MSTYITLDGGTTNTRLTLVREGVIKDRISLGVGAQKNIDGAGLLEAAIKQGIIDLLAKNGLSESDVSAVIASGMITSEFGLCNLPHITAPAGITELHSAIERVEIPEISDIPFAFIRGVKTDTPDMEHFDIMRGEETELAGIYRADLGEAIYVLPGSHSKIIKTDAVGRITEFSTMLTGEMIKSLAENTILKGSISLSDSEIVDEYLLHGYLYATSEGINKALFKVRVLKNFFGASGDEAYSFFIGAALAGEMKQIIENNAKAVVIGGRRQLRYAMGKILSSYSDKRVILLDDATVDASTAVGAIRIFEGI